MLTNLFNSRTNRRANRQTLRQPGPARRRKLAFERCEDRRLLAALGVTIDRDLVLERSGDGAAKAAIVRDVAEGDLTIALSSSDTSEITVQPTVTMLDGVTSVDVPLNAIDDTLLDGTQVVTITASAPGFASGSDTIDVRDTENLSFALAANSLTIGESTTATVTRNNTNVEEPLLVDIQYERAADVVVPEQVEIPPGQQSAQFSISVADNGVLDGTRTFRVSARAAGYFPAGDVLEIREEGVVAVAAARDGQAVDVDQNKTFSNVSEPRYSLDVRNWRREHRALFEFDIASIGGVVDAASLTFKLTGYSASQGIGPTVELFGYAGDGTLDPEDATAGRKVAGFQVPGTEGIRRYAIPLDVAWLQSLVGSTQYVGFSARVVDGSSISIASSRNTFFHESNHPTLQFALSSERNPVAVADSVSTDEDVPTVVDVLSNDFGSGLTVASVATPEHGGVVVNGDQTITYTPPPNFHGSDRFEYTVRDANGDTDSATVDVTVSPVNDSPIARNDSATTNEDTAVVVNVLANDTDVDGDPLGIDRVTRPSHGRAVINQGRDTFTITYTPFADYHGDDSFVYSVTDGKGGYSRAFVSVAVRPVNDAPEVVDAVFALEENSPDGSTLGSIEATDVDGDLLHYSLRGEDAAAFAIDSGTGVVSVADSAQLDFETRPRFDFEVAVTDGNGGTATAPVTVHLTDVLEVEIDVLPDDPLNLLHHKAKRIEVAVLAAANFDPLGQIDLSSVKLRPADSTSGAGIASHRKHGYRYEQRDVNGDGRPDLVLQFETSDVGLRTDEMAVVLEGKLLPAYGGEAFSVEQPIDVVRGKGHGKRK